MPLLNLANELLHCISENQESERDINAFAQANRRLYRLLNNYLYCHNIHWSRSSALLWAAQQGQEAKVQRLLGEGANVRVTSDHNQTPLSLAAANGHEGVLKLLLDKGADLNAQGRYYGNELQAASLQSHEQVVKLLLDKGADVNAQGGKYGTALQAALF
jgi:ankyrin repeat protein